MAADVSAPVESPWQKQWSGWRTTWAWGEGPCLADNESVACADAGCFSKSNAHVSMAARSTAAHASSSAVTKRRMRRFGTKGVTV